MLALCALGVLGYGYWKYAIPTHRVRINSELVMLGDLNGDGRWGSEDAVLLDQFSSNFALAPDKTACLIDMNQNGLVDVEDSTIIRALVNSGGDPYAAEESALSRREPFPRPRELYRYVSTDEYRIRPLFALPYAFDRDPSLVWLSGTAPKTGSGSYAGTLDAAIYSEAARFEQGWLKRRPGLLPIEKEYAAGKIAKAKALFEAGEKFELLLTLMELSEDAETLTVRGQPGFSVKLLAFRDHLREILGSRTYAGFKEGKNGWEDVLKAVSGYLASDLGLGYDFNGLPPPRDLANLENYLQRAEWQYYKSTASEDDFRALINYAQHDPRYLRAVSRTSKRHMDPKVENHNLPMVLLFREALRIEGGDKKKAVGLLDEAIRIPFAWVKSIPKESLPASLALDNFLLPGNKEDGADKSRHWNVFGGICVYKSPHESLDLALRRETQDLRNDNYSEEAMREFFRDMIANLNGMYHVMSVNPDLLSTGMR
ncbi:hypothetical protein EPN96_01100 [bacterium]|nr:MAG: hypothetical protein EPN96_01100 [bacterium]